MSSDSNGGSSGGSGASDGSGDGAAAAASNSIRGARGGRLRLALAQLGDTHAAEVAAYRRCLTMELRGSSIEHNACAEEWEALRRAMRALA